MKIIKKNKKIKNSKNINKNKIAICLLSYQPTLELIELYDDLYRGDKYDIYIIVDDNNYDIYEFVENFPDIQFIKIKEEICYKYGYIHLNYMVKKGEPSAWDKGIYYFCEVNKINYKYVWFLEDDVFIPMTDTIKNIDVKYANNDILLKEIQKSKNINIPFDQKNEVLKYMDPLLKPYLSKSMVCSIRLSNNFLDKIKNYVKKNGSMFFLEFFFPTLAIYYNLDVKKIIELKNIEYRKLWGIDDIFREQKYLFHPVKKFVLQKSFRKTLKPNEVYFLSKRLFKENLLNNKYVEFNNMNLIQIILFKNEKGNILKLIQDTSINDNLMYIEVEKKHKNNKFIFKSLINSIEDIEILISVLKFKFFTIQTITREHYIYNKNVNIYFVNIPSVIEFVEFESHSENKLKDAYNQLGYTESETKTLDEVINESDKIFGIETSLDISLEFEKYQKSIKYVKKNKELYTKLVEKQYKNYKNILDLFGDKVKIYNKRMFN